MLMMLAFGPKSDDDDADDARLLAQPQTMRRYQWCWLVAAAIRDTLLCHVGRLGFLQACGPEKHHRQHD